MLAPARTTLFKELQSVHATNRDNPEQVQAQPTARQQTRHRSRTLRLQSSKTSSRTFRRSYSKITTPSDSPTLRQSCQRTALCMITYHTLCQPRRAVQAAKGVMPDLCRSCSSCMQKGQVSVFTKPGRTGPIGGGVTKVQQNWQGSL